MARFRDWINLGRSTFGSLTTDDVTGLYVRDWTETRKMLIADHSATIEREPKRIKRWMLTTSATMYGLARRLAPGRRILFALSFVWFFACLVTLLRSATFWVGIEIAGTFMVMTLLLAMELIDKIKFRDELTLARDLQATLIPKQTPQTPTYDIAAFNHIANTVGGDIYDFVPLPDGRVAVLFGDASGHGMAAGLVMAVAHAAFRTQLDIDPSPEAIVGSLNRILCRTGSSRSFFACCYFLLSPDGTFVATIAGHPPVLKIDAGGKVIERIGRGAYPLGVKTAIGWEVVHGSLAAGERLLLHSDGLTETRNEQDREFGDAYVEAICGWHPDANAAALIDTLVGEWRMFCGRGVAEDDVSVAAIVRR